jgi:rubrerythrin
LIEKNKFRKKRSRPSSKRPSAFKHLNGSNSPKTRVSITRALEKYISMAQDAHSNGDRIVAENFYQYAEHYQRLLNEDKSHGNLSVDDKLKNKNMSDSEMTDIKLSRTQRAINAKDERYKKIEGNNGSDKQKGFTRDGIEALKPFQPNIGEEESHSS